MTQQDAWPWPDRLDGAVAAPESHRVIFENDQIRVLEVVLEPGQREPEHTHARPSVMVVTQATKIRYFRGARLMFESVEDEPPGTREPRWMEAEGPHSVENIDDHAYRAYRVELKPQ
ncbi:hypothetical protein [Kribbella sp. NPDC004875]|uniref:hypothetical protein n=1 Tax=Kribbella sp. NPDC004875 TaxID=3364107 RepID=UPI0036BA404E